MKIKTLQLLLLLFLSNLMVGQDSILQQIRDEALLPGSPIKTLIENKILNEGNVTIDFYLGSFNEKDGYLLRNILPVVEENSAGVQFNMHYFGQEAPADNFSSLDMTEEAEESLRQLTVKELYPADYLPYLMLKSQMPANEVAKYLNLDLELINSQSQSKSKMSELIGSFQSSGELFEFQDGTVVVMNDELVNLNEVFTEHEEDNCYHHLMSFSNCMYPNNEIIATIQLLNTLVFACGGCAAGFPPGCIVCLTNGAAYTQGTIDCWNASLHATEETDNVNYEVAYHRGDFHCGPSGEKVCLTTGLLMHEFRDIEDITPYSLPPRLVNSSDCVDCPNPRYQTKRNSHEAIEVSVLKPERFIFWPLNYGTFDPEWKHESKLFIDNEYMETKINEYDWNNPIENQPTNLHLLTGREVRHYGNIAIHFEGIHSSNTEECNTKVKTYYALCPITTFAIKEGNVMFIDFDYHDDSSLFLSPYTVEWTAEIDNAGSIETLSGTVESGGSVNLGIAQPGDIITINYTTRQGNGTTTGLTHSSCQNTIVHEVVECDLPSNQIIVENVDTSPASSGPEATDGAAVIFLEGGSAPFSIIVFNEQGEVVFEEDVMFNPFVIENLSAGQYWIKTSCSIAPESFVVDVSDCGNRSSRTTCPKINVTGSITNLSTEGATDGAIDIDENASLIYKWDDIDYWTETPDRSDLIEGTYCITALDANCCIGTACFEIDTYCGYDIYKIIEGACNSQYNGAAFVEVNGGIPPYNYSWSTGTTGSSLIGVPAGDYELTVFDARDCYYTTTITIPAITDDMLTVLVNHETGTLDAIFNGSYSSLTWEGPGATTENEHNPSISVPLSTGEYCVTIETELGCSVSECVNLNLLLNVVSENQGCANPIYGPQTIMFCLTSSGGNTSTGYTYEWSGDLVEIQDNCAIITVGSDYCVEVSDNDPLSPQTWTDCGNIPILEAEVVSTKPACAGESNGQICLQASGGAEVFTYQWTESTEPQENPCSPSNLPGGQTYTVTVTDGCGSEIYVDHYLPESENCLVVSITNVSPSCPKATSGTACAIVEGGTGPYLFEWYVDTDVISYNACAWNALPADQEIMVTVTDVNGNTGSAVVTLPDYVSPSVTNPMVSPACENSTNGSISFVPVGGRPDYSYQWIGSVNTTTEEPELNNISAGTYCVYILDECGKTPIPYCFIVEEYENDSPIELSSEITNYCVNPSGGLGGIDLIVEGNDGSPLTYEWSNGANTQDLDGIQEGVYDVIVTQSNGCDTKTSMEVEELNPVITDDVVRPACEDMSDGVITIYSIKEDGIRVTDNSFFWSHDPSIDNDLLPNLPAGNYTVTVVTDDGCEVNKTYTIEELPLVGNISANVEGVWEEFYYDGTLYDGTPGSIDLTVSEEDNPNYSYQYEWSNGATSQDINGLEVGWYTVTVTNNNRCPEVRSYYVYSLTEQCAIEVGIDASDPCNSDPFTKNKLTATPNNNGSDPGPYHYRWTRNGYNHHEGVGYETTKTEGSHARYCVTITDDKGCKGSLCMDHDRRNSEETIRVNPSTDLLDDLWENHTQDFNLVYGSCAGQKYCGDFPGNPWWFPGDDGEGTFVFYPLAGTNGSPCTGGGAIFCTLDDTFIAEVPPILTAIENTDGDDCGCLFPAGSINDLSDLPVYASMCPEDYSVSCYSNCDCPMGFTCDDNECVAYSEGLECDTDDGNCQCPDDLICVDGLCIVDSGDGTPQCGPDDPCYTGRFCKNGKCIDCPDIFVDYCWGLNNTCGNGGDCQIEIDVWSSLSGVALIEIIESGQVLHSASHGVGPNFPQSFTETVAHCPYVSQYWVRVTYSTCPTVSIFHINDGDVYCNNNNCFTGEENIDTRHNEISMESDDSQFFVYPNPFLTGITIEGLNLENDINADVVLFNGLGQEVMNQSTYFEKGETLTYIEGVGDLPPGMYVMIIRSEGKVYKTKRLIKANQ